MGDLAMPTSPPHFELQHHHRRGHMQLFSQDLMASEAALLRAMSLDPYNARAGFAYACLLEYGIGTTDSPQERFARMQRQVCRWSAQSLRVLAAAGMVVA